MPAIVLDETDDRFQLEYSSYKVVYNVAKALRAHDKIFGEAIDHLRAATGTSIIPRTNLVDNFERKINIAALGLDAETLQKLAQLLTVKIVNHSCDTFEVFIERLADWIKRTGREPTPKQDWQLSSFCQRQRILRAGGKLSQERIDALDSIGFRWVTKEDNFSDRINKLVDFIEAHGRYPKQKESKLGRWVGTVRQRYREGKLEKDRIDALNRKDFVWDENQEAWTEKAQAVKNFISIYGSLPRQRANATKEERMLAGWISNQTKRYRSDQLSDNQINVLRPLSVELTKKAKTKKERWYENFDLVHEYIREHGVVPPQSTG